LTPEVEWHFFKLRAIPCTNEFQRVIDPQIEISQTTPEGHLSACRVETSTDGLGNAIQWGSISEPHTKFTFRSSGQVLQTLPYALHTSPEPFYCAPTYLTSFTDEMMEFAAQFTTPMALMKGVHSLLTYTPYHTTNSTTSEEVWKDRRGVCQDYAHLMIALCRANGWYARYANGFIEGEGATHAWVEVNISNTWFAYDPTLNRAIEWGYVKIAHGRDANDCPTNRGRFYGWTSELMEAKVKLAIIDN